MRTLIVVGCGGHGIVVAECAATAGASKKICFLDDRYPDIQQVCGLDVVGDLKRMERYIDDGSIFALGIGDNAQRLHIFGKLVALGARCQPIIHPSAVISPSARIGDGTVVLANAVVNARADVGEACIINTAATVDHDSRIFDGVHVSPGSHLAGGVTVGARSWIGIGAVVIPGRSIGKGAVVGAGAAVLSDIPDGIKVGGIPAVPLKSD